MNKKGNKGITLHLENNTLNKSVTKIRKHKKVTFNKVKYENIYTRYHKQRPAYKKELVMLKYVKNNFTVREKSTPH